MNYNTDIYTILTYGIYYENTCPIIEKCDDELFDNVDQMIFAYFNFPDFNKINCIRKYKWAVDQKWKDIGVNLLKIYQNNSIKYVISLNEKTTIVKKNYHSIMDINYSNIDIIHHKKIKDFCETLNIEYNEPKWILLT